MLHFPNFIGIALSLFLAFASTVGALTFSDKQNRSFEGEILSIKGEFVKLRRFADRQIFEVASSLFSEENMHQPSQHATTAPSIATKHPQAQLNQLKKQKTSTKRPQAQLTS